MMAEKRFLKIVGFAVVVQEILLADIFGSHFKTQFLMFLKKLKLGK